MRFCREERLEQMVCHVFRHSDTEVLHRHVHEISGNASLTMLTTRSTGSRSETASIALSSRFRIS